MTRRPGAGSARRPPRSAEPRPGGTRRPSGAGPSRLVGALIVVFAIVLGVWLVRGHRPGTLARTSAGERALLDSLQAADARKDWVTTLRFAERLGALRPRESSVYLARGTAWSNYAVAQRPGRAIARSALRTSLERIECLNRALALTDSAGMSARTSEQWVKAMRRLADMDETIGLPGDALLADESIKQRAPGEIEPALRAYWLRALFYDPVHPDTSEWDRRMRSLGRR